MDYKLTIEGIEADMTWEKADTILNNIWLSLMVPRGAFFQNPDFGSRLHLLQRAKNTESTADLAREYCLEALQWLKNAGRADRIDVYTQTDKSQDIKRLKLLVEAVQSDGRKVTFGTFLEVV
ncbi:MAG: phage GP46 family protein [Thermodesulfobacteriota bacterium]|nr:phage GP46 family protein [Thermodesulfobacteriota bacterium]